MTRTAAPPTGSAPSPTGPTVDYLPGLDGLRALAVIAVVLFHAGVGPLDGGFLGVEVFFAVSGYLITALMVAEYRRTGSVAIGQFWLRRARRLLPALFTVVATVSVYTALVLEDELAQLRGEVLASLVYVTNWYLIVDEASYFEALGRPPLLQHLWSLAIEEQYYLVWPLVMTAGLALVGGRAARLAPWLIVAALVSAAWMGWLYAPGEDTSRVYYGTDTRASALLLGSALGVVWTPWRLRAEVAAGVRQGLDLIGFVALGVLAALVVTLDGFDDRLYPVGFVVTTISTLLVLACVVHPASRQLPRVLGWEPLRQIGLRSYGLYLWHWPVFMVTRPRLDVGLEQGPVLVGVRLAITVVLTEACYRWVETPIRQGAAGRMWAEVRSATGARQPGAAIQAGSYAVSAVLVLVPLTFALIRADDSPVRAGSASAVTGQTSAAAGETGTAGSEHAVEPSETAVPEAVRATSPVDLPRAVTVVGDSVATSLALNVAPSVTDRLLVSDGSIEGCGLFDRGRGVSAAGPSRDFGGCEGFAGRWAERVRAEQAEVSLLVIGAWEMLDVETDEGVAAVGSAQHDLLVMDQLDRGIDALEAAGAAVALMALPCFEPVDGGGLSALPERGDRQRQAHLNELLAGRAATPDDQVWLVEPPPEFCSDPEVARDLSLRWDGVHYGPLGGVMVWEHLAPQLLEIPVIDR